MTAAIDTDRTVCSELAITLRAGRTKPIRSMRKFVEEEVRIPKGEFVGERIRLDRQPVQGLLFDEIDSGHWIDVWPTGPSQSGKSVIAFDIPIAYHASEYQEEVIVGVPDGNMVHDKWSKEIKPIFESSPTLRALLPSTGPGSQGGRVRDFVQLTNGVYLRFMTKGGTDQSKASFTSRVVCVTEAAGWSAGSETSQEANPLEQIRARQRSYDRDQRRTYIEGTVTTEFSLPWSARDTTSKSRLLTPCPHCGTWTAPEREHLSGWEEARSEDEAAELAFFACPECGEAINDEQRRWSVERVRIVHGEQTINHRGDLLGELPTSRRLWFRWSAWHNLFNSIGSIAADEWLAAQAPPDTIAREEQEKKQTQFVWAVPYVPGLGESLEMDPDAIQQRRSIMLTRGLAPPNATHLAGGIDLGRRHGHYVFIAGMDDGRLHIPIYGTFDIAGDRIDERIAIYEAVLKAAKEIIRPGLTWLDHDNPMVPGLTLVDAGYQTPSVFRAWKELTNARRNNWLLPIFGRGSGQMQDRFSAPKKLGNSVVEIGDNWYLSRQKSRSAIGWAIFGNGDHWKSKLHDHLVVPQDAPGGLQFYSGSDREHQTIVRHFTNETCRIELEPGKGEVKVWERNGANHYLDSAYYALIALDRLGWRPKFRQSE